MSESYYVLNQLLVSKKYKCIVLYSLFQLPKNKTLRHEILMKFFKKKKKLIFVLESLKANKVSDIQDIENIWHVKKISDICLSTKEIKKVI